MTLERLAEHVLHLAYHTLDLFFDLLDRVFHELGQERHRLGQIRIVNVADSLAERVEDLERRDSHLKIKTT